MSQTLVSIYQHDAFQRRVEILAARIALAALDGAESPERTLALAILRRDVSREDVVWMLCLDPDVAAALEEDPSNPGHALPDDVLTKALSRMWSTAAAVRFGT